MKKEQMPAKEELKAYVNQDKRNLSTEKGKVAGEKSV